MMMIFALAALSFATSDIFVSESGNDSQDGSSSATAFHSLEKVQATLQSLRGSGNKDRVVVHLSGNLRTAKGVTFGVEASNTQFVGPATVFGDTELTEWQNSTLNGKPALVAKVPAGWDYSQFYVTSSAASSPRPTLPRSGEYTFAAFSNPEDAKDFSKGSSQILANQGDIPASKYIADAEVLAYNRYSGDRLPVQSYDSASGTLTFKKKSSRALIGGMAHTPTNYKLINVAEAYESPGQWFHEKQSDAIYYYPKSGESAGSFRAYIPTAGPVLTFNGAANVELQGFAVRHSASNDDPTVDTHPQSAPGVRGAIQFENCTKCAISNCEFSHLGGYAIKATQGTSGVEVSKCRFYDLGAGAANFATGTSNNSVIDCDITDIGRLYPEASGIFAGFSKNNVFSHNKITNLPFSAIAVGWFVDKNPSPSSDNTTISFNRIDNVGMGILSDMGGIYTMGSSPGTVISNNYITNVQARDYSGCGIYLDATSAGIQVVNNVVNGASDAGFFINWGHDNQVSNNVFTGAKKMGQLWRVKQANGQQGSISFDHNVFASEFGDGPPYQPGGWDPNNITLHNNFYYSAMKRNNIIPPGDDGSGRILNPMLDANGLPADNSPVYRFGFNRISLSDVGPRS